MDEKTVDVVVVGAGPAGLQAAVHAARKKASVLILGRLGDSAIARAHVENYLCVDGVADGLELLKIGLSQATRFGAGHQEADVLKIEQDGAGFRVETETGSVLARTLVLATGSGRKKLKVPGERELLGKGVSYCVDCDANFFRNARVAVVGEGSAAVDGALTLLGYTPHVTLVARRLQVSGELRARLAASAARVREGVWVTEITGDNEVRGLRLDDGSTLEMDGVFVELGAKGAVELAVTIGVALDSETMSHIAVNRKQETNIPGLYAAGDLTGQPHQMAKAVGEGCVAGWEAANLAHALRRQEQGGRTG